MGYQIDPPRGSPGAKLRKAREKLGMTQREFASDVLGVSKSFLSQLETGARGARDGTLLELLRNVFGIEPAQMLAIPPYTPPCRKPQRRAARRKKTP